MLLLLLLLLLLLCLNPRRCNKLHAILRVLLVLHDVPTAAHWLDNGNKSWLHVDWNCHDLRLTGGHHQRMRRGCISKRRLWHHGTDSMRGCRDDGSTGKRSAA